jgi:hypothetical protein
MRKIVWCLLAIGAAAAPVRVQEAVALVSDDFSRFPPGVLSAPIGQLNGAIQEYHYIEHRGVRTFPWRNPIVHLDSWAAGDEGNEPYLEQHLINDDLRFSPLFVTGDKELVDGSDEGFLVFDLQGKLLKHLRLGHAQTQSVGKYRPDLPGLQIAIANFWRNPGIVTLLDHEGNILAQDEMIPGSSHLEPVNWRGDGQEFALLSGNVREGGMIDGELRRVVMFPDDGHPDLASAVRDLTGDQRDEIVLWDQRRVWIYTPDRPFSGGRVYAPVRNPHYNDSNYRATVSLPAWAPARGGR